MTNSQAIIREWEQGRVRLRGDERSVSLLVEDTGDGFDIEEARKSGGLGLYRAMVILSGNFPS